MSSTTDMKSIEVWSVLPTVEQLLLFKLNYIKNHYGRISRAARALQVKPDSLSKWLRRENLPTRKRLHRIDALFAHLQSISHHDAKNTDHTDT